MQVSGYIGLYPPYRDDEGSGKVVIDKLLSDVTVQVLMVLEQVRNCHCMFFCFFVLDLSLLFGCFFPVL